MKTLAHGRTFVVSALLVTTLIPLQSVLADGRPRSLPLTGVIRDFRERTDDGGHPDFEPPMDVNGGRFSGNVATTIGEDRKPVFTGEGAKIAQEWRDAEHRQICYALYDPERGDVEGSFSNSTETGITSAESFDQWYRDVPGLNLSRPLTVRLELQPDGNYVFDDVDDPRYRRLGGFFPIDDQLFGNSGGMPDHNFHFTFEIHAEFTYDPDAGQHFMFIGDDDVWVFIDDRLVIDLGGVHAAHDQYVELDRLGLEPGETYDLDFFFAERHRTKSNFRIETNIVLKTRKVEPVTGGYD